MNAAESARAGKGQLIELIGDAGVGKSRLVHELANASISTDCRLLIGGTASYAQSYPYFSFRNLFRKELGITGQDDDAVVGEKLAARLSADPSLAHLVPAFRALLGLRRPTRRGGKSIRSSAAGRPLRPRGNLSSASPARRPVICILEDMQWMDDESRATLDYLVRGIDGARILVCVTSRAGSASLGNYGGYYTRIPIQPLDESFSLGMIDHLLSGAPNLAEFRRQVVSKAQGNPLFLEELARMLNGPAAPRAGDPPSAPLQQINSQVPNTIQSVIAARIDRLSAIEKEVLQVASVVGGDVPASVLGRLTGLTSAMLEKTLGLRSMPRNFSSIRDRRRRASTRFITR